MRQLTKLNPITHATHRIGKLFPHFCSYFWIKVCWRKTYILFSLDNKPYWWPSGAKCWGKLKEKVAGRHLEEYHATSIDWLELALNGTKSMSLKTSNGSLIRRSNHIRWKMNPSKNYFASMLVEHWWIFSCFFLWINWRTLGRLKQQQQQTTTM